MSVQIILYRKQCQKCVLHLLLLPTLSPTLVQRTVRAYHQDNFSTPRFAASFDTFVTSYTINWLPNTRHVNLLKCLEKVPVAVAGGTINAGPPTSDGKKDDNSSRTDGESSSKRKRVSNRNRDPRVMGETPLAKQVCLHPVSEALAKGSTPPATTSGKTHCLSWHLKGKCYNDCIRKDDHAILPIKNMDTLVEWGTQAYP